MNYRIRTAGNGDTEAIVSIFNSFVENSYAAYPERKVGSDFFDRLKQLAAGYPFYVVETENREVVGLGLMRPHHSYETFKRAAEVTYFILPEHTRKGLGQKLLCRFIEEAKKREIDTLLADISSLNQTSIDFHSRNKFQECGRFRHIGKKLGKDFDVVWMQRFINE